MISGAVRRMSLYQALGFEPFGPRVGTPEAPYQPMILTLENFARVSEASAGPASGAAAAVRSRQ